MTGWFLLQYLLQLITQYLIRFLFAFMKTDAGLPFIRCNRIDQNVTVDVYGVSLWEDGVLILEKN